MPKIGIGEIPPNPAKVTALTGKTDDNFLAGMKKAKDIIDGIRLMIQEAKDMQPKNDNITNIPATTSPDTITKAQLIDFGKQFLDNLIKQGYGDKTIAEALADIPFTIKQINSYIGVMK